MSDERRMTLAITAGFGLATALSVLTGTVPFVPSILTLVAGAIYTIIAVRDMKRHDTSERTQMSIRCVLGFHFWWLKAMTPQEINECCNYGAPWPSLVQVCLRCHKEKAAHVAK